MERKHEKALKKGAAISAAALAAIFVGIAALWRMELGDRSPAELWESAAKGPLAGSLALISLAMPFVAMRWRALFPPPHNRTTGPVLLTGILSAAFVFNIAMPGPVGEAVSAGMVKRKTGMPFSDALASLAVSRIIGLGSACAIAGIVYWVAPFPIPGKWVVLLETAALLLGAGSLVLFAMAWRPGLFLGPSRWAEQRLPGFLAAVPRYAGTLLGALGETAARGRRAYAESAGWALAGHVMVATGIHLAAGAIGAEASWAAVLFTYAASIAASVAMFMLPGSAAGWDVLFATTLSVSADMTLLEAGAVTAVVRIQQLLVTLVGLGVVWWMARDLLDLGEAEQERA